MITLKINYYNKKTEKRRFNKDKIVIGKLSKDKGIDITIKESIVSRRHCEILKKNDKWFIRDLGSTNGTFLNGKRLLPFTNNQLKDGDYIVIGTSNLFVILSDEAILENGNEEYQDDTVFSDPTPSITEINSKYYLECLNGKNKGKCLLLDFSETNQINIIRKLNLYDVEGEILFNFDNLYLTVVNLSSVEVKINSENVEETHVLLEGDYIDIDIYKFKLLEICKDKEIVLENSLDEDDIFSENEDKNYNIIFIIISLFILFSGIIVYLLLK